jgi:siroheme synthase-like protein
MTRTHSVVPTADRAFFAAFLNHTGKPGLVVGGGPVAALKVEALMRSGARVSVIAPTLCPRLTELTLVGAVRHEARRFQPGDVVGAQIVIAATDDRSVNEEIGRASCRERV